MVRLYFNLSTQEPLMRIRGAWHPLRSRDNAVMHWLRDGQAGLYFAARQAADDNAGPDQMQFPILEPAVEFVMSAPEAGQLDRIVLVATEAAVLHDNLNEDDPRRDDTRHAGVLAERFLRAKYPNVQVETLLLTSLRNQLYGEARKQLLKLPLPEAQDRIYVCTSPGFPAVNDAMVQRLTGGHGDTCTLFQIEEPDTAGGAVVRHGDIERVAISEVLTDFRKRDILALIGAHQYRLAAGVLKSIPHNPRDAELREHVARLLECASRQWQLDTPEVPGRWGKYFWRVSAGLRNAEAFREKKDVDEWLAWLGDSATFAQDVMGAIAIDDETVVTEKPGKRKKDVYFQAASQRFTEARLWAQWADARNTVIKYRNDYTHRLIPAVPADLPAELNEVPAKFDNLLILLAGRENISLGDLAPKPFSAWNREIGEALNQL